MLACNKDSLGGFEIQQDRTRVDGVNKSLDGLEIRHLRS